MRSLAKKKKGAAAKSHITMLQLLQNNPLKIILDDSRSNVNKERGLSNNGQTTNVPRETITITHLEARSDTQADLRRHGAERSRGSSLVQPGTS